MKLFVPTVTSTLVLLPSFALAQGATASASAAATPEVVQMTDTRSASATTPAEAAKSESTVTTSGGGPAANSDGWDFEYHGYFRAPMRVGIASRDTRAPGQGKTTYHTPIVPDDQYLSWQHTRHSQRSWAEAFLSVGNKLAKGTIALQGFQLTDAAWVDPSSNFGISQAFITLTPDTGYENMRLVGKVGSFWNSYGKAGRYDAGAYDTYLFGRTHALGGTLRGELDTEGTTLWGEWGVGAKEPNPNAYNRSQFTLLNHLHAGIKIGSLAELGLHYLDSFAKSEFRPGSMTPDVNPNTPDGSLSVYGVEGRVEGGMYGYGYLGFSHVSAKDAITVGPAIEVIHAFGGGDFSLGVNDQYLNAPGCAARMQCSNGNGSVNTLLGQYEFSLVNFTQGLEGKGQFWGEGQDLKATLYGMYNMVASDDPAQDGVKKLKFGADLEVSALPWLAAGLRMDRLSPNSKVPEQKFSVISPRVVFRSKWVTKEEISLQYSRYIYNQRTCATALDPTATPADGVYTVGDERCVQPPSAPVLPAGFGATTTNQDAGNRATGTARPDVDVVALTATMWW
ncbi:MAG: hypothetical protein SFV15_24805 [Polyangiaceae bacterium]|nr:hypothetical protein [Polyangiaceae bacterium]